MIENKVTGQVFRQRCEDKNILKEKGSMYIGKGEYITLPASEPQDLSATGFTPVANTYYKHTGATTTDYTQGVIYLYDGEKYVKKDLPKIYETTVLSPPEAGGSYILTAEVVKKGGSPTEVGVKWVAPFSVLDQAPSDTTELDGGTIYFVKAGSGS